MFPSPKIDVSLNFYKINNNLTLKKRTLVC